MRKRVIISLAESLCLGERHGDKVDELLANNLAQRIEEVMFQIFSNQTSSAYKAKYRTLLFNLKDERNQGLRDRFLLLSQNPAIPITN